MNWKNWKLGFAVAILTGILTGCVGLAVGLTTKQILILFLVNVGKDGLLFLQQNPAAQVKFEETTSTSKNEVDGTTTLSSKKTTITTPTDETKP